MTAKCLRKSEGEFLSPLPVCHLLHTDPRRNEVCTQWHHQSIVKWFIFLCKPSTKHKNKENKIVCILTQYLYVLCGDKK